MKHGGFMKYIDNDELERYLAEYYATGDKVIYEKLCTMFFEIAQRISVYVARKKKFSIQKYVLDDIIQAGTLKAIKEIYKFSHKRKAKDGDGKQKAKAFNFFSTVIHNEMIQELMKEDRKNWYNHEEKKDTYIKRLREEKGIVGVVNEYENGQFDHNE